MNLPSAIVTLIWNNYMKTSFKDKAGYPQLLSKTRLHKKLEYSAFYNFMSFNFKMIFFLK